MLTDWDHTEVQWFDTLESMWADIEYHKPEDIMNMHMEKLATQLALPMSALLPAQSKFFKHHYRSNWHNRGIMTREIDVIRSQEGW
jgi:hypothetical protein